MIEDKLDKMIELLEKILTKLGYLWYPPYDPHYNPWYEPWHVTCTDTTPNEHEYVAR